MEMLYDNLPDALSRKADGKEKGKNRAKERFKCRCNRNAR